MPAMTEGLRLARPHASGRGCLLTVITWLMINLLLAAVLFGIFVLHAQPILTHLARTTFTAIAPYHFAMLDPRHTSVERQAFSNAYYHVATIIETNALIFTPPPVLAAFNGLLLATRDQFISRGESATFVSNVAAAVAAAATGTNAHGASVSH